MIESIYQSVMEGDAAGTTESIERALAAGIEPGRILNEGMIAAMDEVGRLFEQGEYYVPEMLISARAMQTGLKLLQPHLVEADIKPMGVVVLGTVKGDLHDIGKNLVGMMLEGAGFSVIDLGVDVSPEKFVEAVRLHQPQIIGLSALLTTTMPMMKATVAAVELAGLRDQVKILVGGAPVTQQYADSIGADYFAPDASAASARARLAITA